MAGRNRGSFSMKLHGGRPVTGSELRALVEKSRAAQTGADMAVKVMKQHTPKITGNLAGNWGTVANKTRIENGAFRVGVVNTAPYAKRVDRTSRRNAGYIMRGVRAASDRVKQELKARVASIVPELWNQHGGRR